jgi:hypothetical protein
VAGLTKKYINEYMLKNEVMGYQCLTPMLTIFQATRVSEENHKSTASHLQILSLYNKRDQISIFRIVNFPFICSNIPAMPACGVYLSHLKQYSRDYG